MTTARVLFVLVCAGLWSPWGAQAQTDDVLDRADPGLLTATQCKGFAAVVHADVNGDGTAETAVAILVAKGNGGFVDTQGAARYVYAFSYLPCGPPSGAPAEPGQIAIRFVDATAPGYLWNDPRTWKYKTIPSVSLDASWSAGAICPRPNTTSPYQRVQAYRALNQVDEVAGTSTGIPGAWTRYEFADPAGVQELYVHTDYCENELDNLVLGEVARPRVLVDPASTARLVGRAVTFRVRAQGTAPLQYQWHKNGAPLQDRTGFTVGGGPLHPRFGRSGISGAATAALTIVNLFPTDGGDYSVVVTNAAGSATSKAARLTVQAPVERPKWQVRLELLEQPRVRE